MSDELLICFLRARKHDVNRSFNLVSNCTYDYLLIKSKVFFFGFKLQNYYRMTKVYPELLNNLRFKEFNHIINLGYFYASPKPEQNGSRVMIARFGTVP